MTSLDDSPKDIAPVVDEPPPEVVATPVDDIEPEPPGLEEPSLYLNRELSLLEFNRRVLAQARSAGTPLLERLRFLTISSTNLDEFFEIRVAGLREQIDLEVPSLGLDGHTPQETLQQIDSIGHDLVAEQYHVLRRELMPALEKEGVSVFFRSSWTPAIREWVSDYFEREVQPVLTPMGLDPAHPFPMVLNKSLNFVVSLKGKDAFGRSNRLAVVQAPRILPRMIQIPEDIGGQGYNFITLSGVIHENVGELFPGMSATGCHPFRVTRNSDLWVDEEEVDDLLPRPARVELRGRNFGRRGPPGDGNANCQPRRPASLLAASTFELKEDELYRVDGPVNLHRLSGAARPGRPPRPEVPANFAGQRAQAGFGTHGPRPVQGSCAQGATACCTCPFQAFSAGDGAPADQAARDPDVLGDQDDRSTASGKRLAGGRRATRGGAERQGGHRRGRAARAVRRGGEHRPGHRGCRKAGVERRLRDRGLQGARQDAVGRPARGRRRSCGATCTWAPATTTRARRGQYTDLGLITCRRGPSAKDVHNRCSSS